MTVNVPANSAIYISSDGGVAPTTSADGAAAVVDVVIAIDNILVVNGGFQRLVATNRNFTNAGTTNTVGMVYWSVSQAVDLSPGNHSIAIAAGLSQQATSPATPVSPTGATVSGNNTSVLQGQLTVIIVKQ